MSYAIELNGRAVVTASVTYPFYGVGTFRVTLPSNGDLPDAGGALTLTYDGLAIRGSLLATYTHGAGVEASCLFGYRGWSKSVTAKAYQSEAGVRLNTVLSDLARDTGELFDFLPSATVGEHWNRPAAIASRALTSLAAGWRVLPDGRTSISPPAAPRVTDRFDVTAVDEARGIYEIASGSVAQFLPGAVFQNAHMPAPRVCASVTHSLGEMHRAIVVVR